MNCTAEVFRSLKNHGWVISPEEQDAHELFHALASTLEEEIANESVKSLLDVSWLQKSKDQEDCNENKKARPFDLRCIQSYENDDDNDDKLLSPIICNRNRITFDLQPRLCLHNFETLPNFSKKMRILSLDSKKSSSQQTIDLFNLVNEHADHITNSKFYRSNSPFDGSNTPFKGSNSPFKGHLASLLQCTECKHKNPGQWSSFESLSLYLPNKTYIELSLPMLLDAYISLEEVTGVKCDSCTTKHGETKYTTFKKQLVIGKLPQCLCFHIQRTSWMDNGMAVKRHDHVSIPLYLNMEPYTYTKSISFNRAPPSLLGGREGLRKSTMIQSSMNRSFDSGAFNSLDQNSLNNDQISSNSGPR